MGLVPSNHDPHPDLAVAPGMSLVTTRPVKVALDRVRGGRRIVLAAGTRLRHLRTEYMAECIPPIEYADIHCEVRSGDLAGREIVILTFQADAPVPEFERLAQQHGISVDTTAG